MRCSTVNQAKQLRLTNEVADWIAEDCRPISIVEDTGLRKILRTALNNDRYSLPSRKTIRTKLNDKFNSKLVAIKEELKAVTSLSVTTDGWTSLSNESYMGVTVHFLKDWNLKSYAIAVKQMADSHTAANNFEQLLRSIFRDRQIDNKAVMVCTDSARNMVNAINLLGISHMPCLPHLLQLSINKAIAARGLDKPLALARKIVGHFKRSPIQSERLHHKQEKKESLVSKYIKT